MFTPSSLEQYNIVYLKVIWQMPMLSCAAHCCLGITTTRLLWADIFGVDCTFRLDTLSQHSSGVSSLSTRWQGDLCNRYILPYPWCAGCIN